PAHDEQPPGDHHPGGELPGVPDHAHPAEPGRERGRGRRRGRMSEADAANPSARPTMLQHSPHVPAAEPGTAEFFLEVALRIGRRVAEAAEWRGEGATWTIMSPDRDQPELRVAKPATASGT